MKLHYVFSTDPFRMPLSFYSTRQYRCQGTEWVSFIHKTFNKGTISYLALPSHGNKSVQDICLIFVSVVLLLPCFTVLLFCASSSVNWDGEWRTENNIDYCNNRKWGKILSRTSLHYSASGTSEVILSRNIIPRKIQVDVYANLLLVLLANFVHF